MPARWHTVLIKFRDETTFIKREEVAAELNVLGAECGGVSKGLLFWIVGKNLDTRKGYELVLFSMFRSDRDFERYQKHPLHEKFVCGLSEVADWIVGDVHDHDYLSI